MSTTSRVVLVTGGTRGIGRATVEALVHRGNSVMLTFARDGDAAEQLVAGSPENVSCSAYHLGSAESAQEVVNATQRRFGQVDAVIANAGVWSGGRLATMDPAEWESVVMKNLVGTAQLCRAAIFALEGRDQASITLVSSVVGLIGGAGDSAYASAKAGFVGLTKSLAKELGPAGVRVNCVAPGFVETDMTAQVSERSRNQIHDAITLGRAGTSEEIARAVVFLAEEATYSTGTVMTVDGGWSL